MEPGIIAADLEGTLTTGATWRGLGRYLLEHGRSMQYRVFFLQNFPLTAFRRFILRNDMAVARSWLVNMARLIKDTDETQIRSIFDWIVEHELWKNRRQDVIDELKALQDTGKRLILVSGAYQPALDSFARRIGASGAIGTPLEIRNGRTTGKLAAAINIGAVKVERLHEYLKGAVLDAAYGDTLPDVDMLSLSQQPVAVYPDSHLRAAALQKGWRIIG